MAALALTPWSRACSNSVLAAARFVSLGGVYFLNVISQHIPATEDQNQWGVLWMKVVNKYWPRLVHIGLGDIGRLIGRIFGSCDLQRAHEIKFYHVARLHIAPQTSSIFCCFLFPPHGMTGKASLCAARFGHTRIRCSLYWIKFVGQIWL